MGIISRLIKKKQRKHQITDFTQPEEQHAGQQEQSGLESEQQEQELSQIVRDDDVELGLPLNEATGKKGNISKVFMAGGGLLAVGAIVAGLIGFTSGSDTDKTASDNKAASDVVQNMQPKDFNADKEQLEIQEAEAASEAKAGDAAGSDTNAIGAVDTNTSVAETLPAEQALPATQSPAAADSQPVLSPAAANRQRRFSGEVTLPLNQGVAAAVGGAIDGAAQTVADTSESSIASMGGGQGFGGRLNNTITPAVAAQKRGNRSLLLTKGTNIQCVLETRVITTQPGFTRCQVTRDVYSANGKVLLLERGTKIIGEQTSALLQGQARVFVLWNEVETPQGVKVSLASPGSGALGESGHGARVNYHFWQRFGGAILISMISDVGENLSNKSSNGDNNNITYEHSSEAAQQMATEALKNSINIPPTGTINQGSLLNVMVARDVDFSAVYNIVRSPLSF